MDVYKWLYGKCGDEIIGMSVRGVSKSELSTVVAVLPL